MFIDSMQFMNSSLDKLVKNLSDEDFKYLLEELIILTSTGTVLKDLMKKNYLLKNIFPAL